MGKSNALFSRLTDVQSDAASAIFRLIRKNDLKKGVEISTSKERYLVKIRSGGTNGMLDINDGMDSLNEFKIDPVELISILESLEEQFYE